jgi:hypothetical protein
LRRSVAGAVPCRECDRPAVRYLGTGVYNRAQGALIRQLGGKSLPYRFILGEDASDQVDAGYYQGNFVLTNKQLGAADGANATAQFTWASDGVVTWTDGAEIIVLDPLTMTPKIATHAVAYTGTVTGTTTGSTLTATSSDATTLTVSGSVRTRTVGGTFSRGRQSDHDAHRNADRRTQLAEGDDGQDRRRLTDADVGGPAVREWRVQVRARVGADRGD